MTSGYFIPISGVFLFCSYADNAVAVFILDQKFKQKNSAFSFAFEQINKHAF